MLLEVISFNRHNPTNTTVLFSLLQIEKLRPSEASCLVKVMQPGHGRAGFFLSRLHMSLIGLCGLACLGTRHNL